jgi:hypothetical protein
MYSLKTKIKIKKSLNLLRDMFNRQLKKDILVLLPQSISTIRSI